MTSLERSLTVLQAERAMEEWVEGPDGAITVKTPSKWPVVDFVELTASLFA